MKCKYLSIIYSSIICGLHKTACLGQLFLASLFFRCHEHFAFMLKMKNKKWIDCSPGSDNIYCWSWMVLFIYAVFLFHCWYHPFQLPFDATFYYWMLKATEDIVYGLRFLSIYFKFDQSDWHIPFLVVGKIMFRVTEESLMDRLNTITHLACLSIPENCRYSLWLHLITWFSHKIWNQTHLHFLLLLVTWSILKQGVDSSWIHGWNCTCRRCFRVF
jgi:hypothetical protein